VAQSGREESQDKLEEMKFQCPCTGCINQYDTWLELVEHTGEHGTPVLPGSSMFSVSQNASSEVHKCELCYKTFANETRLQRHMAVHGGEENKPLQCECGKRFLNNSALAGHVKTHAGTIDNLYDCPICLQEFEQVSSLKDHVYIHRHDGVFTCPHCQKNFTEYPLIRKHIRAFHAEKRFPCAMCLKSFTSQDKLKIHMVKHSDAREYMCSECGKQFKRKDKLREHTKRMHSKARKEKQNSQDAQAAKFVPKVSPTELHRFIYKCHTCMLGFKRRGMLVNHLFKRHPEVAPTTVPELNLPILKTTKDFYCQYCDKVYKSSSKRKAHIIKNHPGAALPAGARKGHAQAVGEVSTFSQTVGSVTTQPHGCELCHKQYASKAKLLQHMRKKHNENIEAKPNILLNEDVPPVGVLDKNQYLFKDDSGQDVFANSDYDRDILTQAISINELDRSKDELEKDDNNDQPKLENPDQLVRVESGDRLLRLTDSQQQYLVLQSSPPDDMAVAGPSRPTSDMTSGQYNDNRHYNRNALFAVEGERTTLVTVDPTELCLDQPGTIIVEAPSCLQPAQLHQILESAGVGQGFRGDYTTSGAEGEGGHDNQLERMG
jgi:hypothetical protein